MISTIPSPLKTVKTRTGMKNIEKFDVLPDEKEE
jgi:hypothetical protein